VVQKNIWEAPRMPATTARGTDAARTEEAAPVVVVEFAPVVTGALLALGVRDMRLVTLDAVAELVLFPVETVALTEGTDPGEVVGGSSDGRSDGTEIVSVPDIRVGNVSIFPSSLSTKSSENIEIRR